MFEITRREVLLSLSAGAALRAFSCAALTNLVIDPEDKATWDLTELYADDGAWEQARQTVLAAIPQLAGRKGTLGISAVSLQQAYSAASDLLRTVHRLGVYAQLMAYSDLRLPQYQQMQEMATQLSSQLDAALAWMDPETLSLGQKKIEAFFNADPRLAPFRFRIEDVLRQGQHTLSSDGEALLAGASPSLATSFAIERVLVSSDIPHSDVLLSTGEAVHVDDQGFASHVRRASREDRKLLYDAYYASYAKFQGSLGATLSASITGDVFKARARHFKSSLQAALFVPNIPAMVYTTLLAEVDRALPQLQRFYDLERNTQHLTQAELYDLNHPLSTYTRNFSVPEMRTLSLAALQPLGPEYTGLFARATQARWMDPLPRPGKYPGGLTDPSAYDVHPYLLLNLTPDYSSATIFIHEWGHAMHNMLAKTAQPYSTYSAPVFLQEIGSTCNEQLLVQYLIAQAKSKEEKLFYLYQQLRVLSVIFFGNAMTAEFEAKTHALAEAGEALSGERFSKLYLELMTRYYGPAVHVDPAYAIQWIRYSQFYDAFYLFQYCTSITAAVYFSQSVLKGGTSERERYLSVLRAGGSDYGYSILTRAGLDLASPEPYRVLVELFSSTLNEAEALVA